MLPAQAGAAQQASPTVHKGRSVWSRAQGQEAGLSLWAHGDAATPHRVRPRMGELSQCVSLPWKRSSALPTPSEVSLIEVRAAVSQTVGISFGKYLSPKIFTIHNSYEVTLKIIFLVGGVITT